VGAVSQRCARTVQLRDVPTLRTTHTGGILARTITLVRHGETLSNISGTWQGHTDSPLTERGRAQVSRLSRRMDGFPIDLLVSSDLGRAATTAESIGTAELLPTWREFHIGDWEGRLAADVRARHPELEDEGFGTHDFHPTGGERFSDFRSRVEAAFWSIADRIEDGQHAVVVTHGGVIQTLVAGIIGTGNQPTIANPSNTSLTTVRLGDDGPHLWIYNDDLHLDGHASRPGGTRIHLIRHAETEANLEHRWWGRGETPLSVKGRGQAEALAASVRPFDALVSSPLSRALDTARPVAEKQHRRIDVIDDLVEIAFGTWEGLTPAQIREVDPVLFERVFVDGIDEPKGTSGESFSGAGERLAGAVAGVAASMEGNIGVFTHGGVTRAYVAGLLDLPFARRDVLPVPRNTSLTEVTFGETGPQISSYNVATYPGV
jgi:broad specificity phosphatase PhoE